MGLDMYLTRNIDQTSFINQSKKLFDYTPSKYAPRGLFESDELANNLRLSLTVGYWRKANATHNWFVMLNDDVDDCTPILVDETQLAELLGIIDKILSIEDRDEAIEYGQGVLPATAGCFFGDTEYTDAYFDELRDTKSILEHELDLFDELSKQNLKYVLSWTYRASW